MTSRRQLPAAAPLIVGAGLLAACTDAPLPTALDPSAAHAGRAAAVGPHGAGIPGSVVFQSNRTGSFEIFVMDPDGGNVVQLTHHPAVDVQPDWSTNGRFIVFMSTRSGDREIWRMASDGSGAVNLSDSPGSNEMTPVYSRNGQRIAFMSDRTGNMEIFVMDADGSDVVQLTDYAGTDGFPDWSPNGKQIVFERQIDGQYEVFVMNADGSGVVRLTNAPGDDFDAVWSPNGRQIAFRSRRDGYCAIYVMNADGSDPVNLTPKPTEIPADQWCVALPSWSRNGKQIYFQGFRPSTGGDVEIFVMNADGSGVTRLTFSPGLDLAPVAR